MIERGGGGVKHEGCGGSRGLIDYALPGGAGTSRGPGSAAEDLSPLLAPGQSGRKDR